MAKAIGISAWITIAAIVALLLSSTIELVLTLVGMFAGSELKAVLQPTPRAIALFTLGLIALLLIRPTRKLIWKTPYVGQLLREHFFEDIDGDWTVTIESNWPTIDAMRQANCDEDIERFNPSNSARPQPKISEFPARIRVGWDRAEAIFYSNELDPLKTSRTISFELMRKCATRPATVFWGFQQFNTEVDETDEDSFLGAAMLEVISSQELVGTYWNNRSWRKGLNTAGRITMTRKIDK